MTIAYVLLLFLLLALIAQFYQQRKVTNARRQGIYPPKGMVTADDITRLAASGERILAIKAYREFHGCGLKKAKKAIDAIE